MGWLLALLLTVLVARGIVLLPDVLPARPPAIGDREVRWTIQHGAPRLDQRPPDLGTGALVVAVGVASGLLALFALGSVLAPVLGLAVGAVAFAVPLMAAWAARTLAWGWWWASELSADADGVELGGTGRPTLRLPWSEVRAIRAEDGYLVIDGDDPWFVPVAPQSMPHAAEVVRALEALRPAAPPTAPTLSAPLPLWSITALLGFLPTIPRRPPAPIVAVDGIEWEMGHNAPPSGWAPPRAAPVALELGAWAVAGLIAAAAAGQLVLLPVALALALLVVGGCFRTWRPYWSTQLHAAQHGIVLGAPGREPVRVPWSEVVAIRRLDRAVVIWTRAGAPIRLPIRVGEEALAEEVVRELVSAWRSAGPALPELPPELPEALRALTRQAVRRPAPWERG